jgi:hypothetical protein
MALIPADVGLRLRLDNELTPQPLAPIKEIAADLPRLVAGQPFTAQIRDVLPQSTYTALVAGKTITLSLPESVQSGDVLELVVVEQTPKGVLARLADPNALAGAAGKTAPSNTSFSPTAQLLRNVLIDEGGQPAAAPLNRGEPLLTRPPQSGAELVPVLNRAVKESGLFYESHQAQWVAGRLPLTQLLQQPQGQKSLPDALRNEALRLALATQTTQTQQATQTTQASPAGNTPVGPNPPPQAGLPLPAQAAPQTPAAMPGAAAPLTPAAAPLPAPINNAIAQNLSLYQSNLAATPLPGPAAATVATQTETSGLPRPAAETNTNASLPAATSATATAAHAETSASEAAQALRTPAHASLAAPLVPDDLRALVQQQLDAAGSQRLLWHGEVWPGQPMDWQVEWQEPQGPATGSADDEPWQTRLRLIMPRLGALEARLHLGPAGVRIQLDAADAPRATDLRLAAPALADALSAAGVPLRGFQVAVASEANPAPTDTPPP